MDGEGGWDVMDGEPTMCVDVCTMCVGVRHTNATEISPCQRRTLLFLKASGPLDEQVAVATGGAAGCPTETNSRMTRDQLKGWLCASSLLAAFACSHRAHAAHSLPAAFTPTPS